MPFSARSFAILPCIALAMMPLSAVQLGRHHPMPSSVEDAAKHSSSLVLVARPSAQRTDDPSQVRIDLAVWNFGEPRTFMNNPSLFYFDVRGPNGALVRASGLGYEPMMVGDRATLTLAHNGYVGELVNLACDVSGYIRGASQKGSTCLRSYNFRSPGTYRIVVHYNAPNISEHRAGAGDRLSLASDTVRVRIVPR